MAEIMTSMERVLTALSHKEPDRVPLFLLFAYYGAKESGLSIQEYFKYPDNVAECQVQMQKKYKTDCYYSFYYAAIETEAFNGKTIFYDDSPPNSSVPVIRTHDDILSLEIPDIRKSKPLQKVLETTRKLKKAAGSDIPVIGVVMSPFSLPVMQMGFESYLKLMYFQQNLFDNLMEKNITFCTEWANAQLDAGATAICYFNPLASPSMIDKVMYLSTGYPVDKKTVSSIKGPTAFHLASGKALPVMQEIIDTGSGILGISSSEDLMEIKKKSKNKITLLGNLNGADMINWNREKTVSIVKNIISAAAGNGGFILSDNHGEIPWLVSEETLLTITECTKEFGSYPLRRL